MQDREASYDGVGTPPRMPDVLQASADPLKPSRELREICKENGIEFVSYSTDPPPPSQQRMRVEQIKILFLKTRKRPSYLIFEVRYEMAYKIPLVAFIAVSHFELFVGVWCPLNSKILVLLLIHH